MRILAIISSLFSANFFIGSIYVVKLSFDNDVVESGLSSDFRRTGMIQFIIGSLFAGLAYYLF